MAAVGLVALAVAAATVTAPPAKPPPPGPSPQQPLPPLLHVDWQLLPPLPAGVEDQDGGFVDATTLVYAFGLSAASYPGCLNTSWSINISDPARKWVALPPVPAAPRQGVSATVIDGVVYFYGGFNNAWAKQGAVARTSPDAVRLSRGRDSTTWSWEAAAPPPFPVGYPGVVSIGSKLYLFGGSFDETLVAGAATPPFIGAMLHVMDTADPHPRWVRLAEFPGTPRTSSLTPADGKLYVLGGTTGADVGWVGSHVEGLNVVDCWCYDPA